MKDDLDKILLSIAVLVVAISGSIFSYDGFGWWLPVLGGAFSIGGLMFSKNLGIDFGILISAASFFYFAHDLPFTYGNLLFILAMYFLYFGLWSFLRRSVLIEGIKDDLEGRRRIDSLTEYKEHSALYILWVLFLGSVISTAGALIAIYGFVGPFPSNWITFLMLLFSSVVVLAVYTVVVLLPKLFTIKDYG